MLSKLLCSYTVIVFSILLKGLQYYSDDPGKVGQTFVRLENDFDKHVDFLRELPSVLEQIQSSLELKDYLHGLSEKIQAGSRSYQDYLNNIQTRITKYEEFFKVSSNFTITIYTIQLHNLLFQEIIKYSVRANCATKSIQKALELVQSIPKKAKDNALTGRITNYPGDVGRLGKIIRHVRITVHSHNFYCRMTSKYLRTMVNNNPGTCSSLTTCYWSPIRVMELITSPLSNTFYQLE